MVVTARKPYPPLGSVETRRRATMAVMKVGLLLCDRVRDELHDVAGGYEDMFSRLFADHEEIELIPYDAVGGELPAGPEERDAWVVSGSRYSVNDDQPWIRDLEELVGEIAEAGVPYVGICFGHQLLANALGGSVVRSERGWGVGVKEVEVVPELGLGPTVRILNNHEDQVETLPVGAEVLGWNEHCPVSMFRVGRMVGIQGHPEFDVRLSEALMELLRGRAIPDDVVDAGLASLSHPPDADRLGEWIVGWLSEGSVRRG